jgi:hypothetical protein
MLAISQMKFSFLSECGNKVFGIGHFALSSGARPREQLCSNQALPLARAVSVYDIADGRIIDVPAQLQRT